MKAQERANKETSDVIRDQLVGGLANITSVEVGQIVIAYEPVWSIGTGKFASPRDVERAVKYIRRRIQGMSRNLTITCNKCGKERLVSLFPKVRQDHLFHLQNPIHICLTCLDSIICDSTERMDKFCQYIDYPF